MQSKSTIYNISNVLKIYSNKWLKSSSRMLHFKMHCYLQSEVISGCKKIFLFLVKIRKFYFRNILIAVDRMTKNIFFIRTFSQKRHDQDLGEEIRLEDSLLCDSERERKRPETNI